LVDKVLNNSPGNFLAFVITKNLLVPEIMKYNLSPDHKLLTGQSVLLIEDDEVNQILLSRMINEQGGHCHLVADKDVAIHEVKNLKPDLVIVDISLKGIKTLDYIRVIKSLLPGKALILGITSINYRGRAIFHGLDGVMYKPIDYGNFKDSLLRLLTS
jgi:CheY-like chemotaxis protein